jgi:hypothetical protein
MVYQPKYEIIDCETERILARYITQGAAWEIRNRMAKEWPDKRLAIRRINPNKE